MLHKRKIEKMLIISLGLIFIVLVVYMAISIYISAHSLEKTIYRVEADCVTAKIILLTDIHGSEFGEDNEKLVNEIRNCSPEIIAIAGDLINSYEEELDSASQLISGLAQIAPVYISLGNQEREYQYDYDVKAVYAEAGATVLDFDYLDIMLNDNKIRIGGFYGYGFPQGHEVEREEESLFLEQFQDTDSYKILLSHIPHAWYVSESLDNWDINLVLSGHIHGGQVVLPFIGGLYVPDMGFFPGKIKAITYSENKENCLIISRGLGTSHELLPRINNIPEVVVVDLVPK